MHSVIYFDAFPDVIENEPPIVGFVECPSIELDSNDLTLRMLSSFRVYLGELKKRLQSYIDTLNQKIVR